MDGVHIMHDHHNNLGNHEQNRRTSSSSPLMSKCTYQSSSRDMYRFHVQNPDRLINSVHYSHLPEGYMEGKSYKTLPPRLPPWLWKMLVLTLGVGQASKKKTIWPSTLLHIATLTAALLFGASGMFFNAYDIISGSTITTPLSGITRSIIGLCWMALGIYANCLAVSLFNNARMVDCIRIHSKTFMKVSTAFIVCVLFVGVLVINLYNSSHLLEDSQKPNSSILVKPNCASLEIEIHLCQIYFTSKVIFTAFCCMWNILVVCIFLSVCRTHTIGIRRFMKELVCDAKIYEEYCMIQALEEKQNHGEINLTQSNHHHNDINDGSWEIWDDDIKSDNFGMLCGSSDTQSSVLLKSMRRLRHDTTTFLQSGVSSLGPDMQSENHDSGIQISHRGNSFVQFAGTPHCDGELPPSSLRSNNPFLEQFQANADTTPESQAEQIHQDDNVTEDVAPPPLFQRQVSPTYSSLGRPPIMRNEDLMFTYFKLVRRLGSTSQVLQRWISSWITFVLLWCGSVLISWIHDLATIYTIIEVVVPLVALGLLTSAYAEVNYEGERLGKCILPTAERIPVIYYFKNTNMELKIFSFTMSYTAIMTVTAGIAVTFASRIILDQFNAAA